MIAVAGLVVSGGVCVDRAQGDSGELGGVRRVEEHDGYEET